MGQNSTTGQDALAALADLFARKGRFLLLTHEDPDGDALGSLLGLGEGLETLGKHATLFVEGRLPRLYGFLPGAEKITDRLGEVEPFEAAVLLDCHTLRRAGVAAERARGVPCRIVLDHHLVTGPVDATHAFIDPSVSATGEIVYHLLRRLGVPWSPSLATNLFTAITTDTGSFSFDNTSPACLEAAADLVRAGARPWQIFQHLHQDLPAGRLVLLRRALETLELHHQGRLGILAVDADMLKQSEATGEDAEGFVNYPRSVRGVELAVLIRENGQGLYDVSLRSQGRINVSALAETFGGGGHHNAAGFSLNARSLSDIKGRIIAAAAPFLSEGEAA
jgi:phosphoesterase RecJ-like protein